MSELRPAGLAFDAVAPDFDTRYGEWQSVAAQRRAVRRLLLQSLPARGRILELGGGTGEDAVWFASRGFEVLFTDASPAMAAIARAKLSPFNAQAEVVAAEDLEQFADRYQKVGGKPFDGAFSNFAPLNCVQDLRPVARGLARLMRPDAVAGLVLFGTFCPGEIVTEMLRGRPGAAFRRLKRGEIPARIAKKSFSVVYHRRADLVSAMAPWFVPVGRLGVGVFVPPSAAEPWVSRKPALLRAMEKLDHAVAKPFAALGDHILYTFRRTDCRAP